MDDLRPPHIAGSALFDPGAPLAVEAIARLRAHPRFADAARRVARGLVDLYQGNRLLNQLINDRARALIGFFVLYLHYHSPRPGDPHRGFTVSQIIEACLEHRICSAGRAKTLLMLMRMSGYIAPAPEASDRRLRLLVATERLIDLHVIRWRNQFEAMALIMPEGAEALAASFRPEFVPALIRPLTEHFRMGFRVLDHCPGIEMFTERNAGLIILINLLVATDPDDTMPPSRPVPISISALSRRFGVSRTHVLKLLRDAEREGLIKRTGASGEHVILLPRLTEALLNLFATAFLLFAHCVRTAMDEI